MNRQPRIRRQAGTTLIEALIAAVVIGIGLLGIASLLVKSMQASTLAEHRAVATDLAWSLADRIRANLKADNSYLVSLNSCPTGASVPTCFATPGSSLAAGASCSAADVAAADLEEIFCAFDTGIRRRLPDGRLSVTCNDLDTTDADACTAGSQIDITITWAVRDDLFGSGTDRIIMPVITGAP